jgi:hypothetical protein
VLAVVWCAIVRHRLRVCFAAFIRARNHIDPALAPLILLARPPRPVSGCGVAAHRSGRGQSWNVAPEDRGGVLGVGCPGGGVAPIRARLVRIDITRRDPLRLVVAAPLATVPAQPDHLAITAGDSASLALDLLDVAGPTVTPVGRR